jgi:N-terminal acetyltransferase B complex catalytic subunit
MLCAVLGKAEGEGKLWHGHVTAVTVAPECRRLGLATKLMSVLEETTEKVYGHMPSLHDLKRPSIGVQLGAVRVATERVGHQCRHNGYFVDLFVRKSNELAITLYSKLGYSTYRRVIGYYSGQEDALGAHPSAFNRGCRCTALL